MTKTSTQSLTIKDIFITSRPISWVNTAAPFVVGYLLSSQVNILTLMIGTLYFLFPYNLLLYGINDIFDYESDSKNPRKNSLEGGLLHRSKQKKLWYVIGISNLPFLLYLLLIGDSASKVWFGLLIVFCITYSAKPFRFKEVPFLDSLNSSLHFTGPFIYGLLLAGSATHYWPAILAFLLWGMASHALGAIQDIKPDRVASIKSIATVLGAKRTNTVCILLYSLSCFTVLFSYFPYGILTVVFLSFYILNTSFFRKYKSDAQSGQYHRGWQNFLWLNLIVGFWLTQLLIYVWDPLQIQQYYILIFGFFLFIFFLAQLGLTLYNIRAFSRPNTKRLHEWPKVSVILHAYNQQDNISSTLLAILGQQYPQFEIIFTDLGSTDNTRKIAESFQDSRLMIIDTPPVQSGWTLNSWVSQQLFTKATGDIIVSLSADTILLPNALSIIASLILEKNLSIASILPSDQNKSIAQQIILSQNHYFMLGMYPSALLSKYRPRSVNASANLMAFVRSSLSSLGGFELVRKSPLEDFDLTAEAKSKGLKTGFFLGNNIAMSQNHASFKYIINQNIRRYYPALHFSMPLTMGLITGGVFVLILPGILFLFLLILNAFTGIWLLALALLLSYINRAIITIISKQSLLSTLLYPVGVLISLAMLFYSMLNYELLKPRWQKRKEAF